MPKAIVIGCNGQDGTLLCTLLHQKDYSVYGVDHSLSDRTQGFVRFSMLDVCDSHCLHELIAEVSPDEVYYLAAYHHSAEQPQPPRETVGLTLVEWRNTKPLQAMGGAPSLQGRMQDRGPIC